MTRTLIALLLVVVTAGPAQAQGLRPVVKYGKWALAAGALGMNLLAARSHDRAEETFDALETYCGEDHIRCLVNIQGHYADDHTEDLYQASLRYDRHARRWLLGAETALVGAAAMFVWELTRHTPKPDNVPFEPEVRSLRWGETGVGVRVAW